MLAFIGQEVTVRADGKVGKGLFSYLRGLAGLGEKGSQREVVANVFKGVQNRMVSGYLLRDIINKINGIHFRSSEEIHTLSHLYESMLREMRDAAGDSGEFYTPRPVVRFMVQVTDPKLGETVLDPACGTGGFLVGAYDHIAAQVTTPAEWRKLQRETLFGQEAKPLPYMLVQMNLLLHGLEAPQIAYGNTLDRRINEIGHGERVEVIPANLLFFERGGPTDTIWYYELPLPEGRKKYTKTTPLQFDEFASALAWWDACEEGPQACKVDFAAKRQAAVEAATPNWQRAESERNAAIALGKPIRGLDQTIQAAANGDKAALQEQLRALKAGQQAHEQAANAAQAEGDALYWPIYNLDLKNPHAKAGLEHADPKDLIASMRSHEAEVMRLLGEIEALVGEVQA